MFGRTTKDPSPPPQTDSILKLREAVKNSDRLTHLPDQFANLLHQFQNSHCHPALIQDVHTILGNVVCLTEALLDETISTATAIHASTNIMGVLQRVLLHLESARPGRDAFAILMPETSTFLPSVYASREEAESQLSALRQVSLRTAFVVVPVKVTSQYALQPKAPDAPLYADLHPEIVVPTLAPPTALTPEEPKA